MKKNVYWGIITFTVLLGVAGVFLMMDKNTDHKNVLEQITKDHLKNEKIQQVFPISDICQHPKCSALLSRTDDHLVKCKAKVRAWFGKKDCNREYYTCQSSTCDRPGEHLVKGDCGDNYLQKEASKHARYTIPCPVPDIDDHGTKVACYSTEAFVCKHNHFFRPILIYGSSSDSRSGNGGGK